MALPAESCERPMKTLLRVTAVMLMVTSLASQDASSVRRMFEAGQYQDVVQNGESPDAPPEVVYATAQSQQMLGNTEGAIAAYGRLADLPEDNPWRFIGASGQHLLRNEYEPALDLAQQAVNAGSALPDAHFQLGLVKAKMQDWGGAAEAFDRATQLNPSLAYAYYYGGLMHYRANRLDRMANQFDRFLKLAPNAPERPEVMQIMKTVRGR